MIWQQLSTKIKNKIKKYFIPHPTMEKHLSLLEARNEILKNDAKQGATKKTRVKTKLIKNWTFRLSNPKLGIDDK